MSNYRNKFKLKTITTNDTIKIYGDPNIKPKKIVKVSSNLDHRIAMTNFVAGQITGSKIWIKNFETVSSSFPNFLKLQKQIGAKYEII